MWQFRLKWLFVGDSIEPANPPKHETSPAPSPVTSRGRHRERERERARDWELVGDGYWQGRTSQRTISQEKQKREWTGSSGVALQLRYAAPVTFGEGGRATPATSGRDTCATLPRVRFLILNLGSI